MHHPISANSSENVETFKGLPDSFCSFLSFEALAKLREERCGRISCKIEIIEKAIDRGSDFHSKELFGAQSSNFRDLSEGL